MPEISKKVSIDYILFISISLLFLLSVIVLRSIAPSIFPLYYLYFVLSILVFFLFLAIDFEIISLFSTHIYWGSIILLLLPLLIGQVTRGAVRWIPIGPLSIQPAEIVRPFLLVFFANYLTEKSLDIKRLAKALFLFALPLFLIVIAPSFGVAVLTTLGFIGVVLASGLNRKYLLTSIAIVFIAMPLGWKLLAPYQRSRVFSFLNPSADPLGAGYNSIQSMVSVGSGMLAGRGLGKGVQTQLAFLPEKHTDFIFAAVSEELGFIGATIVILGLFVIFWRLIIIIESARSFAARAFVSGLFLTLFIETLIHIGMNLGLLPITGVPLPLVSAGGSSLLATMIGLGIALGSQKPSVA
ncbi:rod shape-determining protein RodA [Patescibacteria group bacterium]|nr:rod shape-determining protein RodA [Patescibacteria group bacterium]MBU0776972.1 rod shape-determining protein RodA [Patescibacteria group bacterium]MBU0845578.1 rod shape-determining protein RodA [Patescibacteria group bacterium]MBU0923001.1 rod shape-determining protein RodA [Patescibacteria group bacterium]MBU1066934.1 rod shape-determining protein RodA [Patescibacteria group bacterium]